MISLRSGAYILAAGALLGLFGMVYLYGQEKGSDAALERVEQAVKRSETETTERIKDAPTFTHGDPDARRLLCRIAGLTDCPM